MRRKHSLQIPLLITIFLAITLLLLLLLPSNADKASATVDEFYQLEQQANYSAAWELFHQEMQERFSKDNYIIDRTDLVVNQFGTDTFTYSLSKPEKVENWKMTADSKPLTAYKIIATLTLVGKYGHFDYVQYIYVTKVDKEWKILWDYKNLMASRLTSFVTLLVR
ncbi:hypothetical protein [Jeotgalibacillus marinus]|uniref:DUF4440 domain-containing protein n=1 Tax=Jeotgalibacillus marinus TaxID=86667 RepID=A0ABV3Q365_9BACL